MDRLHLPERDDPRWLRCARAVPAWLLVALPEKDGSDPIDYNDGETAD